ncbi:MAG: CRTAC1 family protein [Polyangiales bacterium]
MNLRELRAALICAALIEACTTTPMAASDAAVAGDVTIPPTDALGDVGDDVEPPPAPSCRAGTGWDESGPAFRERSDAWGLGEVTGKRLATADLDGDGFSDLILWHDVVNQRTDLNGAPDTYRVRVLMNRPADGGGRRFVESTRASNLLAVRGGDPAAGRVVQAVAFADVDNDGDLDVYTGTIPTASPAMGQAMDPGDRGTILLNDGRGVFSLGPESDATSDPLDFPQTIGAVFVDADADGRVDLYVGYHSSVFGQVIGQQSQLFRGDGAGAFADRTDESGLLLESSTDSLLSVTNTRPLYGLSACDVNGDGRMDLLGAAYGRQFNLLFTSAGDRFRDESEASGVGGDANRDPSGNLTYQCYCAAGAGRCPGTVPAPPAGACGAGGSGPRGTWRPSVDEAPWRLNGNTFSIACGDVDNDGDIDLYTGEIAHADVGSNSDRAELLLNDTAAGGDTRFRRPGRAATGLTIPNNPNDEGILSNAMFDFDNDGRLDIWAGGSDYPNLRGYLFAQRDGVRFEEVGIRAGVRHPCALGMVYADFDHDGDLDLIVGTSLARTCAQSWMNRAALRFYENVSNERNWLSVRLVGRGAGGANRAGVGATVRVTAGGVTQTREIQGNWGLAGLGTDLVAHFGLGAACEIDRVEVRWPDATGTVQTLRGVVANHRIEVRQGEARPRYLRD